jgi:hypothetical protein
MRLLIFVAALALSADAHEQGTTEFTARMTSPFSDAVGNGTFTLTNNRFVYDVTAPWGLDRGEIRGPGPFPEGQVLFNLHLSLCDAPGGNFPGGCFYRGTLDLSELQVDQLLRGEWYVRASWDLASVQGPIVPVPEPSPFLLLAVGAGLLLPARALVRRKRACTPSVLRMGAQQ